jgi:hypothetical protein
MVKPAKEILVKFGDVHKIIKIPEETGVIHKLRPGKAA